AYDLAAGKAPVSHTHPWSQITGVPAASLTAKGTVQLSSAINSTSEILAATPKAVKAAYDLAAGKAPASHTHPWSQITGVPAASLTAKGTVQLSSATDSQSEIEAATPKAVKAAYDLAAGKAPVSHTHPWSQITGVPAASLTAKGTVQLSSAINSTSEILAATPKAVKAAYDLANGKQPADATLTALAGLATAADRLPYFTGADRAALATLTAIGRAIIAKGSIKDVLNYLGLGEAAKRDVGTGENQIPDMSAWKRNPSSNRWRKLPDGTIIQMGISASGPLGSPVNITLPISFSNTNYCVVASYDNARSGVSTMVSFAALPVSPSQFSLMSSVTEQGINPFAYWIAFGD
ncbi:tail fiber protein, partial [Escherichia coli]